MCFLVPQEQGYLPSSRMVSPQMSQRLVATTTMRLACTRPLEQEGSDETRHA